MMLERERESCQPNHPTSHTPTTTDAILRQIQFRSIPQNILSPPPPTPQTPSADHIPSPTKAPCVSISIETDSMACDTWKDAIIIKIWQGSRDTGEIADKLSKIWRLRGNLHLLPLGHNTFIGTFSITKEKWYALLHGPCRISGHLVAIRPWIARFRPSHHLQEAWSSVWLKLNDIPVEFFQNNILVNIGNSLGTFLATNPITHNLHKASYARICVLIDLANDIPSDVVVDGCAIPISYEGNLGFCKKCGGSEHHHNSCNLPSAQYRREPTQNRSKPIDPKFKFQFRT